MQTQQTCKNFSKCVEATNKQISEESVWERAEIQTFNESMKLKRETLTEN